MLKALRHPPLARLWAGQALSAIGDEIYRVGLTWLAVGAIGVNTGYLSAAQFAALMTLSFIGGRWADHWEPVPTMIRVDVARALIVAVPVFISFFMTVPLSVFVVVALIVSALSAFFDPALQEVLPKFSPDVPTLRAATGLMSTTVRMARMVGPALIGLLSAFLPPIHFFTVNALSYLVSATYVRSLKHFESSGLPAKCAQPSSSFREALRSGFTIVSSKNQMTFIVFAKALSGGFWHLGFTLGFALLVQDLAPKDVSSFGLLVASYGAGNLASALYFGNRERKNPREIMYSGYIWLGIGFAAVAVIPELKWITWIAAFSAMGGPMSEIGFLDMIQSQFQSRDIVRIYRLRLALETGFALILLLIAPTLFSAFGPRAVIAGCGVATVVIGLTGVFLNQSSWVKRARHQTSAPDVHGD